MERQYHNELVGLNNRMTDIHAAIGREQLRKVLGWNEQRRRNAAFLSEHLEHVVTPTIAEGATHVFHQYTVRIASGRDEVQARLRSDYNIGSGAFYPVPVHKLAPFDTAADLPHTTTVAAEVLSLPVHPSLTDADLHRIVDAVNNLTTPR